MGKPLNGRKRSPEREQFLFDLMTTACEGGIGYWSLLLGYRIWVPGGDPKRWEENHQAQLRIFDYIGAQQDYPDFSLHDWRDMFSRGEELDPKYTYDLNIDVIARGLNRAWAENRHTKPGGCWAMLKRADDSNGSSGDFDADLADSIVQYGTLGKVVYG